HQPNRRLRLAAEPQTGRREVSALTDARKTLAYDFFRILRAPHVHRIGRTARAGNSGLAISFCAPEEAQRANIISDMLQIKLNWQTPPANSSIATLEAEMATLCIDGGKKAKMRPGDVLGALTGDIGLDGADIGKIAVHPAHVYVAVRQAVAHKAWKQLQGGKIKGKTCRVRLLK
ncbi:DbpA RNA binding domain-containing protein, partial [Escherichia coli]